MSCEKFVAEKNGPADPATLGYKLNHFCLLVNDIIATKAFYGDVLGMREMFTFHASADYDIVYMGYTHGGPDGTGHQTGQEMLTEKTNRGGLIEFVCLKDANSKAVTSTCEPNTFSHVGLILPDVSNVQERREQYRVKILKRVGEDLSVDGSVANAFGLKGEIVKVRAAAAGVKEIGLDQLLLVTDPDGNVIEIQQ